MNLIEQLNRTRELAGLSPLSESATKKLDEAKMTFKIIGKPSFGGEDGEIIDMSWFTDKDGAMYYVDPGAQRSDIKAMKIGDKKIVNAENGDSIKIERVT